MPLAEADRRRLHELLSALSDGRLDDAGKTALHQMLRDPAAQQYYVSFGMLEACLDIAAAEQAGPCEDPNTDKQRAPQNGSSAPAARSSVLKFLTKVLRADSETPLAAAMMWMVIALFTSGVVLTVAFVALLVRGMSGNGDRAVADKGSDRGHASPAAGVPEPVAVAKLTRSVNCQWGGAGRGPAEGEELRSGQTLTLKSGLAELVFQKGARAVLQGPATMRVSSQAAVYLQQGKVAVKAEGPAARGFIVRTQGMCYTDLGTEFAVRVAPGGGQELHVFRGKVQAAVSEMQGAGSEEQGASGSNSPPPAPRSAAIILFADQGIRVPAPDASGKQDKPVERIAADEKQFVRTEQVTRFEASRSPEFARWTQYSEKLCRNRDLVAYYDFQPDAEDLAALHNRAGSGRLLDGRIEGAEWADGHLPGKSALRFAKGNDRVRVNIPGSFEALTAAAWVNVQELPNKFNGILMSDSWFLNPGQCHWQLTSHGVSTLGPCFPSDPKVKAEDFARGSSGTMFEHAGFGAWHHLAVVYDSHARTAVHYLDGRECGTVAFGQSIALDFGPSQIGNWKPHPAQAESLRSFRGCIDELLLLRRVVSSAEIKELYEGSSGAGGGRGAAPRPGQIRVRRWTSLDGRNS